MPELTNTHDYAVLVAALGRELAPFETVTVDDADVVESLTATGVLVTDLSLLDDETRQTIEDAKGRGVAAVWHSEHGNAALADQAGGVPDRQDSPVVSTAQVNHVVGQALGDAQVATREDGVIPTPDLATAQQAQVERRVGPTEVVETAAQDDIETPDTADTTEPVEGAQPSNG